MRIVVIGDVGSRHVGDDAMFEVALARLRARWPEAEIIAMSCDPEATAAQFGTASVTLPGHDRPDEPGALFCFQRALDVAADGAAGAWLREIDDLHDAAAAIRSADALVIAGGGNVNARWPNLAYGRAAALAIAHAHGVPATLTSQTFGPQLTTTQRIVLGDVLGRAEIIGVREPSSAALLAELGILDGRLSHQPDDALAIAPRPVPRWRFGPGRPVIMATLGPSADVEFPIDLQLAVLERIVALADRENAVVALCPHTTLDVTRHEQLAAKLHRRDRVRRLPLHGAAQTRWLVGAASLVVTTRYHSLVFALAAAVPAIGLHHGAYTRTRVAGALGHARVDGFDLDLEHAAERIDEVLARAVRDRAALTRTLESARAVALADLDTHWEKLYASIAPAAQAPRGRRSRAALPSKRAAVAVPSLSLAIDPLRIEGAEAIATARLEGEGLPPAEVFFRFPADAADPAVLGDAFLLAFLFPVMKLGRDLHVRSRVSPSLIETLAEYQSVWHCWRPATYRRVQITADSLLEGPPARERATLFGFSSGLDSSYTAWKLNHDGRRAAGALVLGYNIPLSDHESGAALRDDAARTLASRGIELIPVATNWRLTFAKISWDDTFGIMVAAVLTILSGRFSDGLIAASDDLRRFSLPKGSYVAIDPLLGSARFPIRQHGVDAPRLAKLAAVATWPEAFDALQVCWIHSRATNCGRCIRCLSLATACAALDLPRPRSLPDERFERAAFKGSHAIPNRASFVEDTMRAAALTGAKDPRLGELARVLAEWRSIGPDRVERQRIGDVMAAHHRAKDRWGRLANRVDRLMGSTAWRHHLRPAIRAIRRRS
ncbi:MAG: polysaccharide pyruvyl transferase family protein [Candidatus Rokuibacteriota bacterium]